MGQKGFLKFMIDMLERYYHKDLPWVSSKRLIPYANQEELISEWLEYFRRIKKGDKEGAVAIRRRIWAKMENTEASGDFPFLRFIRRHRLSKDEIEVILYLLYLGIHNPYSPNPFEESSLLLIFERICPHSKRRVEKAWSIIRSGKLFKLNILDLTEIEEVPSIFAPVSLSPTAWNILLPKTNGFKPNKDKRIKELRHFYVVNPSKGLSSVVLSPENREKIRMAISQLKNSELFYKGWGFDKVLEKGKGMVMLFYGPPGTGKSLTAEAMAKELKKSLYVVNVSGLLSMWYGGTEKNMVSAFKIARRRNPVLLFDEADSLLQRRSSDPDFNHQNRKVSTLLQQIEEYDGVLILTTNMWGVLDSALERRVALKLRFDKPDKEMRKRIWEKLIPKRLPLASDVDIDFLAERFELTGGEIKNVILNAARRALMRKKKVVTLRDFKQAAEGERIRDDLEIGFRK